jgi:hypothetical protein
MVRAIEIPYIKKIVPDLEAAGEWFSEGDQSPIIQFSHSGAVEFIVPLERRESSKRRG